MEEPIIDTEEYRDKISTVDADGNRIWVFPKMPKGKSTNYRTYLSWVQLALLFILPFIKVGGNQFLLFDIMKRHFIIFGTVFTTQDLHLFAMGMIILMLFIILFTVVFGRLFCGWACPQTVFMEMVFRKIEYLIEGDRNKQIKLDKSDWTNDKIIKKVLKHFIFVVLSFVFIFAMSWYIVGKDEAFQYLKDGFFAHQEYFIILTVIAGLFYWVFAFFREQVCTNVCPYGRMQGVLLVPDSIVVHYDFERGEPRGRMSRNAKADAPQLGDCIDCNLCVQVCPTGIDIRNGTQLECVNCTACMDACDEVMLKIKRPTGLIRYDSYTGITEGRKKLMTARTWAYSGVLTLLVIILAGLLISRTNVETLFLKVPGTLYIDSKDGFITNLYKYEVINKTNEDIADLSFQLVGIDGEITVVGGEPPIAEKLGRSIGTLFIKLKLDDLPTRKIKLSIDVYSNGKKIDDLNTTFLGPFK